MSDFAGADALNHQAMHDIPWLFDPALIDRALQNVLPQSPQPGEEQSGARSETLFSAPSDASPRNAPDGRAALQQAMRYAVFGGGKRLRSQLVLEAAGVVGGPHLDVSAVLPAACAVELIHAYSLVHDDLPAMDNALTRRGRPSCHAAWGEATAILAGDALLTLAFGVLAGMAGNTEENHPTSRGAACSCDEMRQTLQAMRLVAGAAGEAGMVGGQAIDIAWSSNASERVEGAALAQMHALKTGALIRVACEAGAILGGGAASQVEALRLYGTHLGAAFQLTDDLLDAIGDPHQTGKASSDHANGKATATAVWGVRRTREMAEESARAAVEALRCFGAEADALRCLARFVVEREK